MKTTTNRNPNAPRLNWPTMFDPDTMQFSEDYIRYTRDMEVCYNLVSIGAEILQKKLVLVTGGPKNGIIKAATDGTKIFLPKMHPNRRIATKHELAHNYFKSSIPLRYAFVCMIVDDLSRKSQSPLPPLVREKLIEDLCFLVNVVDDVRVNSLWGLLYPGAGRDMEEWYQKVIGPQMMEQAESSYPNGDIDHLFTYCILLALGQQPTSTKWGRFKDQIVDAVSRVHFQSFKACLLLVKQLLLDIAKEISQEKDEPVWGGSPNLGLDNEDDLDPEEGDLSPNSDIDASLKDKLQKQQDAKVDWNQAFAQMEKGRKPSEKFSNDNAGFDYDKKDLPVREEERAEIEKVLAALADPGMDLSDFLDKEETDQLQQADQLRASISDVVRQMQYDHDGAIVRRAKADVNLINVSHADIVPQDLTAEERVVGEQWKTYFRRVMAAMRSKMSYIGYELNPILYLHQKMTHQPLICYRRPQTGRGFNLTILVDMSGSMMGDKFNQVEKLHRVLSLALDFPFVNLKVFGFNSTEKGTVNIFRFPKNTKGLRSSKGNTEGVTPLSIAIHVAGKDMSGTGQEGYLFVLSDGFPVYRLREAKDFGKRSFVDWNTLLNWTTETVEDLRRQRIRTFCFMIGHALGSDIPRAEDLDRMFGDRMWKHLQADHLFDDSFTFVKDHFLKYLQTR